MVHYKCQFCGQMQHSSSEEMEQEGCLYCGRMAIKIVKEQDYKKRIKQEAETNENLRNSGLLKVGN